jgi:hypothetical protein
MAAANGALLGMIFRGGIPLAGGIVLDKIGGPLSKAGVLNVVLVFFLFSLVVETLLTLRLAKQTLPTAGAS